MDLKTAKILAAGGRALNAIWASMILTSDERLVLSYLGSQLNFRGTFGESRWVSIATFISTTHLSRSTVKRVLDRLEAAGYIVRQERFQNGRQLANSYRLTNLLFDQYAAILPKSILAGISIGGEGQSEDTLTQPDPKETFATTREVEKQDVPLNITPYEQPGGDSIPNREGVQPEPVDGSTVDTLLVHSEPPYTPSKSSLKKTPSFKSDKKGQGKDPIFNEALNLSRLLFNPGGRGRWIDIRAIDAWTTDVLSRHGIETLRKLKADALAHRCLGEVVFDPQRLEDWIHTLGQTTRSTSTTDDTWMDIEGMDIESIVEGMLDVSGL